MEIIGVKKNDAGVTKRYVMFNPAALPGAVASG
jgi:hypothetical protein